MAVKEVLVEYAINGGEIRTVVAAKDNEDGYATQIDLPAMNPGEEIRYRFIARDVAQAENIATLPAEDYFVVNVTGLLPVRENYFNDFNADTDHFFGAGFSVITPVGFEDGAIHSEHPYGNGSGPNYESNYTWQLQIPIRISAVNPIMKFDEIVLVEPGEGGSVFGDDNFFDYVIVEGSIDGGVNWKPFLPGYDSRNDGVWLSRYNQHIVNDNSQAEADPGLYRTRTIDMLENGNFSEDDEVLIRFRLFADQFAYSWGWTIDNLSIQVPVTGISEHKLRSFDLYPVPATRTITAAVEDVQGVIEISVLDMRGTIHQSILLEHAGGRVEIPFDLHALADGMYFMRVQTASRTATRKFIKSSP